MTFTGRCFIEEIPRYIKKRLGDKYGKAVSLEDAKELLKEFDQGKNGGAARRVLEAMMKIANDDSFKFDADYADSLETVSKELDSKKERKTELEKMIKNYDANKAQNSGTPTISIKDVQKELNTLTSEVTKLTNQYNAFAGLKKNFDESKAFIDKTFSSIKGMSDLQLKNISNDTAAALCCAISYYNMKRLNGYEDRAFTDWFQSEISKGNIVKGTHGTAKGVFFVAGAGRIEQTRIKGSTEPEMQRIENSGNALGSMPSQLQGYSGKYVMLWNDTHPEDTVYKANHFTVGYSTGTDVINLDHAVGAYFNESVNDVIGWNNVYRVTKYK